MSQITSILDSIFKTNGGTTRQWRSANEILLTHTEEAKKYVAYMKNKIRDLNRNTQLLALDFLDYSIDDGKIPLWTQVGSKEFLSSLVNIYKTRNDTEVQIKILYLIQKWANKFHKYNTIIPNFNSIYENLKNNDIEFPEDAESTYEKYLQGGNSGNNNSDNNFSNNNFNNNNKTNNNEFNNKENNSENKNYIKRINVDLRTSSYERKYKRLVNKLDDWTQQIQDANIFMDNANEEGFDDDLRGIMSDLETGKNQLVDTIESGKLKDEKLMQISLNVKDDIDMTIKRWNDVKNGRKPPQFKSSFFSDNNTDYKNTGNVNSGNNNNNQNNKAGFDLLGFDDFGGNNVNNNNSGNNNLGNDLFDVFSGSNNNNNSNNNNTNNLNIDFFGNMGNNNNQNNMNNNFFGNNNNNSGQNNQNNINNDFFNNNNQQNNQNNNMNNNFFGNDNNFNQNNQNQNNGNNDLFSQIFNNNTNNNNANINNLQNNLNTVYNETNQFGIDFTKNKMNNINDKNNNQINSNNNNNFNNIMAFNGSDSSNNNFNFNDSNNKNSQNKGNQDFVFNF